ncbi:hypothetical protein B296_00023770 [Ensete ventricosum]|uniref:Uncharacterized protein n=1 Tax=Ensete ventricosum TaxID=4639 RepID=A0A427AQR1_ENSVE|nr:hypothetical protein B296_00023770 [Ensete ventricosum]
MEAPLAPRSHLSVIDCGCKVTADGTGRDNSKPTRPLSPPLVVAVAWLLPYPMFEGLTTVDFGRRDAITTETISRSEGQREKRCDRRFTVV